MNRKSIYSKLIAALLCTSFLYSCTRGATTNTDTSSNTTTEQTIAAIIGDKSISTVISELVSYDEEDSYIDWKNESPNYIKLNGASATVEGDGVEVKESTITITKAGIYVLSGTLTDGQILIDNEDKGIVRLVLNGVDISNGDNPAIYSKKTGKTIISIEEGTVNTLTDGKEYSLENSEDEPDATLFSKNDLTINGSGKLTVNGNYSKGIKTKDDLKITGGDIEVKSVDNGIVGRDLVAVNSGNITINAGGDGIKSTNDTDTTKGFIAIEGGKFNIEAEQDGIQAETYLLIEDGEFNITAGGGSENAPAKTNNDMGGPGGFGGKQGENTNTQQTSESSSTDDTTSTKGLKASGEIGIAGGTFNINSADDSVHTNNSIVINGGTLSLSAGDDGVHADNILVINDGKIDISKSYEGLEGAVITINGGDINIVASDDGINAAGGDDESAQNNAPGQANKNNQLVINGGYIMVNASGDGLDSNGYIYMTNGTVIVSGPTNDGNGALDYDGSFEMTGGLLVAYGSSGMAQATSDSSTQNTISMIYTSKQQAGTIVHLEDSEGNDIITIAPNKDYQSIVISSPEIQKDKTYTLYSGGSSTGTAKNGLYTNGKYTNGTKVVDFSISNSVTWLSESGVTEARTNQMGPGGGQQGGMKGQGGKGGMQGAPTDGQQLPSDGNGTQNGERPTEGQTSTDGQQAPTKQ